MNSIKCPRCGDLLGTAVERQGYLNFVRGVEETAGFGSVQYFCYRCAIWFGKDGQIGEDISIKTEKNKALRRLKGIQSNRS